MTPLIFGAFRLDLAKRELSRDGAPVALPQRAFDCLAFLVAHRDRALGRDELIEAMWGGRSATDVQLAQLILQCRRAVDDDGQAQRSIRTVAGFGYRWVEPVRDADDEGANDRASVASVNPVAPAESLADLDDVPIRPPRRSRIRSSTFVAIACLLLAVVVGSLVLRKRGDTPAPQPNAGVLVTPVRVDDDETPWLHLGGLDVVVERLRRNRVPVLSSESSVALLQDAGAPASEGTLARLRERSGAQTVIALAAKHDADLWRIEATLDHAGAASRSVSESAQDPVVALRALADRISGALGFAVAEPGIAATTPVVARTLQQARAALLGNDVARAREVLLANPELARDQPLLRQQLADVDIRSGHYAEARATLDDLLAQGDGDAVFRAQLLNARGLVSIRSGRFADAAGDFSSALGLLHDHPDALTLGRAYLGRGITRTSLQDYAGALDDDAQARDAFERSGDAGSVARVDSNLGALEILRGHPAQAAAHLQRASTRFHDLGFVQEELNALQLSFVAARAQLDNVDAERSIEQAWSMREHIVSASSRWSIGLYRVEAMLVGGHLADAATLLDSLEASALPAALAERDRLQLLRARLLVGKGDATAALAALDHVSEAADASADDDNVRADVGLLRSRLERATGATAADDRDDDATAITPATPRTPLRLVAAANRAAERGDDGSAERGYRAALGLADEQGVPLTLSAVAIDYADFLLARHRAGEARSLAARVAPWADADFDCAVLRLRMARAESSHDAWAKALSKARSLAGERQIPAGLAQPPPP